MLLAAIMNADKLFNLVFSYCSTLNASIVSFCRMDSTRLLRPTLPLLATAWH